MIQQIRSFTSTYSKYLCFKFMWIFESISTTIWFSTLCFKKTCLRSQTDKFLYSSISISTYYSIWERVRERERENITTFFPLIFFYQQHFSFAREVISFPVLWHHYLWGRGIHFQKIFFIKRQDRSPIPLFLTTNVKWSIFFTEIIQKIFW